MIRLIPRLDIKWPNLVKGIHLEGVRVLGRPQEFARHYYESGADELLYMDVVASLYQRNSILELVERTAREIFIPLTVGGGLRSVEDIRRALQVGADKVALNTAVIRHPGLISEAATCFGSSTIVVSIEAKKMPDGSYEAYVDNGRERTGVEVFAWARRVVELGAGEIIITSIDQEGTGQGFDLELTRRMAESVTIPVISCGGAGNVQHVQDVVKKGKADAVSLASMLHYGFLKSQTHPSEDGATVGPRPTFSRVETTSLSELKDRLQCDGVPCRPVQLEPTHA